MSKLNPFIGAVLPPRLISVMIAFVLRVNRIGLINRVQAQTEELIALVLRLNDYSKWCRSILLFRPLSKLRGR